MSTAEIVAWQLGVSIEQEVRTGDPTASQPDRLDWPRLNDQQRLARVRLGDEQFSYWVLRGAQDALAEHPRG